MSATLTPRQEDAQRRVHELLAELVEVIGPGDDGQADYAPGDAPTGTPTLWEWVIVACWVDGDGQDYDTLLPASGMLSHHTLGLLRAALSYCAYDPAGGG